MAVAIRPCIRKKTTYLVSCVDLQLAGEDAGDCRKYDQQGSRRNMIRDCGNALGLRWTNADSEPTWDSAASLVDHSYNHTGS